MTGPSAIDTLLRLVPDQPARVLADLAATPALATGADDNGYTLLHAAASYAQLDLLRALVQTYHADPNVTDPEGETALFYAETLAATKCLVEELGADETIKNQRGFTAVENAQANFEDGDGAEWDAVMAYLAARARAAGRRTAGSATGAGAGTGDGDGVQAPPPLPPGVRIDVGTVQDEGDEGDVDPEFRRRIEELAARDDFHTEHGQAELRRLVAEAIGGMSMDGGPGEAKSRRTE